MKFRERKANRSYLLVPLPVEDSRRLVAFGIMQVGEEAISNSAVVRNGRLRMPKKQTWLSCMVMQMVTP